MSVLSPQGQTLVSDAATRHGFSAEAVTHMLLAVHQGGGTQAQFNHWEFGGMGQWSQGGMSMIGDMFNSALKARVEALCADLSQGLSQESQVFQPAPAAARNRSTAHQSQSQGGGMQMQGMGGMGSMGSMGGGSSLFVSGGSFGAWWPESLGQPGSTGAQNDLKYAYFPQEARLAILLHGTVTVYDTGPHQISGFGQQQSGDQSLSFTSQFGLVRVADLPVVRMTAQRPDETPDDTPAETPQETPSEQPTAPPQEMPVETPTELPARMPTEIPLETPVEVPVNTPVAPPRATPSPIDRDAIFDSLEKLGALRDMGVLTEAEFNAKKTELLARL